MRIRFLAVSSGGAAAGWCGEWSMRSAAIVAAGCTKALAVFVESGRGGGGSRY